MKINIFFNFIDGPYGGGNQFLKALKKELMALGYYSENPYSSDIIIMNSHHYENSEDWEQIIKLKRNKKRFIHRIDGPISLYRGREDELDKIIACFNYLFCDATVFQSEWSRKECYKKFIQPKKIESTIINASDPSIFYKESKYISNEKKSIISISWSKNERKGLETYKFLDNNLNFDKYDMTFVGNINYTFKNIKKIDPLHPIFLSNIIRQHDIYITASQFDPCSNSLIEALTCGLPSIALNSGGHPEVLGNNGELFNNYEELISAIDKISNNINYYRSKIDVKSITDVAMQYINLSFKVLYNIDNEINPEILDLKSSKEMIKKYWRDNENSIFM